MPQVYVRSRDGHAAGPDLLNDLVRSQRSPWSELHRNRIDDAERGEPWLPDDLKDLHTQDEAMDADPPRSHRGRPHPTVGARVSASSSVRT